MGFIYLAKHGLNKHGFKTKFGLQREEEKREGQKGEEEEEKEKKKKKKRKRKRSQDQAKVWNYMGF